MMTKAKVKPSPLTKAERRELMKALNKLPLQKARREKSLELSRDDWQCDYEWFNCTNQHVRCSQPKGHSWEHTCEPPLGPISLGTAAHPGGRK